jgi:hypothetical protein
MLIRGGTEVPLEDGWNRLQCNCFGAAIFTKGIDYQRLMKLAYSANLHIHNRMCAAHGGYTTHDTRSLDVSIRWAPKR